MEPRPAFDRTLLIPLVIGLISILGLGWVLSTSDLREEIIPPTAIATSVIPAESGTRTPFPWDFPTREADPSLAAPTRTLRPTITPTATRTPRPTLTFTPTSNQPEPLRVGKHDDTHPNIAYDRRWAALQNPGTKNAYQGTIHNSTAIGSEAAFRFTGEGFVLGYQRGRSFGTVTVIIDGEPYSFHEQAFDYLWRSPELAPGDHFVRLVHESGEAVNVDYIEILD